MGTHLIYNVLLDKHEEMNGNNMLIKLDILIILFYTDEVLIYLIIIIGTLLFILYTNMIINHNFRLLQEFLLTCHSIHDRVINPDHLHFLFY